MEEGGGNQKKKLLGRRVKVARGPQWGGSPSEKKVTRGKRVRKGRWKKKQRKRIQEPKRLSHLESEDANKEKGYL